MNYENVASCLIQAVRNNSLFWKDHILQRMRQRKICVEEVLQVLKDFYIIEEYSDDRPFPSYLLMGNVNEKPLHLVVGVNIEDIEIHLITVYIPDESIWSDNFRRRK